MQTKKYPPDPSSRLGRCVAALKQAGHDDVDLQVDKLIIDIRQAMDESAREESEAIGRLLDEVVGKDAVVSVSWRLDSDAEECHAIITIDLDGQEDK